MNHQGQSLVNVDSSIRSLGLSEGQAYETIEDDKNIDEIKEIKEMDEMDELEDSKNEEDDNIEMNNSDVIMLTKPGNDKLRKKKTVKFTSITRFSQKAFPKSRPSIGTALMRFSLPSINMKSLMLSLKNDTIDYLKQQFIYNDNKITL